MNHHFFSSEKIKNIPESIWQPIETPIRYLVYTLIIFYFIYLARKLSLLPFETIFTLAVFIFMSLFIIRPTGHKPYKIKREATFIIKNFFFFNLSIFALTYLCYSILILHMQTEELNITILMQSLHLTVTWLFLPFLFTFILNRFCMDLPYKYFLKMNTTTLKNIDLFTATKQELDHHTKDEIYIDIIQQTELPTSKIAEKDYLKIQNMYLRLIKFWYAQKNYTFKLRYYFPLFISLVSLIYFYYILDFLHAMQIDKCNHISGIQTMSIIGISLTILYFTMSHHINSFLHSEFYTSSILKELNKVYFDKHDHKQQLKLFLDKNFLIYIHDKQHDTHFCVNESEDFQNFISKKKADEEGRNLIIMVYISFFMILFIETSTGDLLNIEDNNSTIDCNKTQTSQTIIKKEKPNHAK